MNEAIREYVERVVVDAPPITEEQRGRLSLIFARTSRTAVTVSEPTALKIETHHDR